MTSFNWYQPCVEFNNRSIPQQERRTYIFNNTLKISLLHEFKKDEKGILQRTENLQIVIQGINEYVIPYKIKLDEQDKNKDIIDLEDYIEYAENVLKSYLRSH